MKIQLFPFSGLSGAHEYLHPVGPAIGNWLVPRLCCKAVLMYSSLLLELRFRTAQCEDDDIRINAARMGGGQWKL